MKTHSFQRARGFTLVELLVVIAIIGVLAALLMPALARAHGKAANIVCISQLRQLGMAVRMYTDDHQNRLPSAELLPSMPVNPSAPLPRICNVLAPYVGKVPSATNSTGVFKCPADMVKRYATEGSSYEWNTDLNGRRMDETRTSTVKIVMVFAHDGEPPQHHEGTKQLAFPPESTPLLLDYEEYHPRAPRIGKNLVYMDGHATGLEIPQ